MKKEKTMSKVLSYIGRYKHLLPISVILAALMIIGGIVFAVISWNILPDTVATQFGGMLDTGAPTIPKFVAVLLPFAITGIDTDSTTDFITDQSAFPL